MIDQLCVFSFSCDLQTDQLYDRSVVRIFIQLSLKSISYVIDQYSAYFHSVVTKFNQLLCDRSVVRIFIQLSLKSISCYMIDQLCVFSFSCD